jgi:hypothetical protein
MTVAEPLTISPPAKTPRFDDDCDCAGVHIESSDCKWNPLAIFVRANNHELPRFSFRAISGASTFSSFLLGAESFGSALTIVNPSSCAMRKTCRLPHRRDLVTVGDSTCRR